MHFPVLVVLSPLDELTPATVYDSLDAVLEPWVASETEPWKMWDWWVIGGRWRGTFDTLPGAEGMEGSPGTPEIMTLQESGLDPATIGSDVVRLKDIDWTSTCRRHTQTARTAAAMKAERQPNGTKLSNEVDRLFGPRRWPDPPRDDPAEPAVARLPVTAVVLSDGTLVEFRPPARRAASDDAAAAWEQAWRGLIERLPQDTVVALLDCHGS